jgi:uncharacterized membrane protein YhaH (DUF805 family)
MNWYIKVLKNYAVFSGRAQRAEYWWFFLFNIIISIVLAAVDGATGTYSAESGMGLLGGIYSLGVLLPGLGVSIRRLHDTGRTGWWLLLALIPILGFIVLLIFMVFDSDPGENQYGPNPKTSGADPVTA